MRKMPFLAPVCLTLLLLLPGGAWAAAPSEEGSPLSLSLCSLPLPPPNQFTDSSGISFPAGPRFLDSLRNEPARLVPAGRVGRVRHRDPLAPAAFFPRREEHHPAEISRLDLSTLLLLGCSLLGLLALGPRRFRRRRP